MHQVYKWFQMRTTIIILNVSVLCMNFSLDCETLVYTVRGCELWYTMSSWKNRAKPLKGERVF